MFIVLLLMGAITAAAPVTKDAAAATALKLETQAMKGDWDKILNAEPSALCCPIAEACFSTIVALRWDLARTVSVSSMDGSRKNTGHVPVLLPCLQCRLLATNYLPICVMAMRIAIGNLTMTANDRKISLYHASMGQRLEILVMKKGAPALANLDELAGVEVHVRKTGSYYESLRKLNERFRQAGKPQMKLTVPDELEDEDMMEMVSAGLLRVIVVDD